MSDPATIGGLGGAGAALLLFVWWLKRRVESGHITIRVGSRSGEQLEREAENLRLTNAALNGRVAQLEQERERERQLTEHWQRQYIEHLQRRA